MSHGHGDSILYTSMKQIGKGSFGLQGGAEKKGSHLEDILAFAGRAQRSAGGSWCLIFFFFFLSFWSFRAAPMAHGSSWARGQIGAVAAAMPQLRQILATP